MLENVLITITGSSSRIIGFYLTYMQEECDHLHQKMKDRLHKKLTIVSTQYLECVWPFDFT